MSASDSSSPLAGDEARRAARNAGAIAIARIGSSAALLLWQLLLGRLLGESEFGIYNTVSALFTIGVTLTAFGMSAILIRDVARRPQDAGRYATAALIGQTSLAILAYIGISGAGLALGYESAIRAYAAVASISLFADLTGTVAYDTLMAREKMAAASAVDVAHIIVRILLAGAALALGFGLLGVYLMTILAGFGRALALWFVLWRDGVRPHFPTDRAILIALFVNGAPLAFSGLINQLYVQIDRLMTTSLLTTADTGHLGAAFVIIYGVIELLSTTVIIAIYPMMSRAFVPDQPLHSTVNATFRLLIGKMAFYSLIVVIPMGLILSLFSGSITTPLFGDRFAPTASILSTLIWYAAVTIVVNVYAQGMIAMNRQRILLLVRCGGLILKLALNLVLLPRIGVIGAAVASTVAEVVVLYSLLRVYRGEKSKTPMEAIVRLAAAGSISAAAMIALGGLHPLVGMIGGGLVYLAAVFGLRVLTSDDWNLLYRLTSALPGGSFILRFWKRDQMAA